MQIRKKYLEKLTGYCRQKLSDYMCRPEFSHVITYRHNYFYNISKEDIEKLKALNHKH